MELEKVSHLSYQDLVMYTDSFSENNYVSHFQFGKFYRGKIEHAECTKYVLVKIWEIPEYYVYRIGDNIMHQVCVIGMEPQRIGKYSSFAHHTDNFSERNCIGHFQFGKMYRGEIYCPRSPIYLLVKTWQDPEIYDHTPGDYPLRLGKELIFLRHEMLINHPGMVKLKGYHWEGKILSVAYEFKPFDSLFNLIPKDGFTWLQRLKAVIGLASLLKFLHEKKQAPYKPFVVHNLDAAHVVLDEEYNPKLCDFSLLSGGIFPEKTTYSAHDIIGCYGSIDIRLCNAGYCSTKNDVFSFGVILLSLISKRVYTEEDRLAGEPYVYKWALKEAEAFQSDGDTKNTTFSLVHKSIAAEHDFFPGDGYKLTKLALDCVNEVVCQRPTMKQVYRLLQKLEVIKQHADFVGAKEELSPSKSDC